MTVAIDYHIPIAAWAAAAAMRGSTTDAKKDTVDIIGLPDFENGIGWNARGPEIGIKNKNHYYLKVLKDKAFFFK